MFVTALIIETIPDNKEQSAVTQVYIITLIRHWGCISTLSPVLSSEVVIPPPGAVGVDKLKSHHSEGNNRNLEP